LKQKAGEDSVLPLLLVMEPHASNMVPEQKDEVQRHKLTSASKKTQAHPSETKTDIENTTELHMMNFNHLIL
jgi:hypothetical protein